MSEERIDFSALDPARDPIRWEARIQRVAALASTRERPVPAFGDQVVAWLRPALALAAVLALLVWGAALVGPGTRVGHGGDKRSTVTTEPAFQLARWAADDAHPTTAQVLEVLGGRHE